MGIIRWLAGASLLLASACALAELTLFEHDNFGGARLDLHEPAYDLSSSGMNDRASSVVVRGGAWQLCEHANFGGRCVTLAQGEYRSLAQMGMNDVISSARPVGGPPTRPPVGGGGRGGRLVLFDGYDFGGNSHAFDQGVANLDRAGFNDRAVSAIVQEGVWEVCEHADFQGDCVRLGPGRHPDLGKVTGRASSVRQVADAGPAAYPPPVAPGPPPGAVRVVLYSGPNFSGREVVIDRNRVRNLEEVGFNDRARSLRVERGYWMFCSDADFEGDCRTFGPGDYPNLPYGLSGRISSGRRISEDYPYNQQPSWGPR
jgi:hypothetical protein